MLTLLKSTLRFGAGPAGLLLALPLPAALHGTVRESNGRPLAGARIEAASGAAATSDADGKFTLDAEPPVRVIVRAPGFSPAELTIAAGESEPEITLLRPHEEEAVTVSAARLYDAELPASASASPVRPNEQIAPPANLTEAVASVPGVSENGQGGLFQVVSVRGSSGHRVQTLVEGSRITGERRAGVSASFIDPQLLGEIDAVRGPASVAYGSGALGGVLLVRPREFTGPLLAAGYESAGNENYQVAGWGDEHWRVGVARRDAGDGRTPDGRVLYSRFTQYSGVLRYGWGADGRRGEALVVPSSGSGIGKPNSDYPARITTYPRERHLLANVSQNWGAWRASLFVHPNELATEVLRTSDGRLNRVENDAFDWGGRFSREFARGSLRGRAGVQFFGRSSVDSVETTNTAAPALRTLDGAREGEGALFATVQWTLPALRLEAGVRESRQRQSNAGFAASRDSAFTGHLGASVPLGMHWRLAGNVGSGLRFPTLSERFFSGTTGAGGTIGNPALRPERALSADLGAQYGGERFSGALWIHRTRITRYIEQVEIAPALFTFENLTAGVIQGAEAEMQWRPAARWRITLDGHKVQGRGDAGPPLADIPPARLALSARWTPGDWRFETRCEYRAAHRSPGAGERAIPRARLVGAAAGVRLADDFTLTLRGVNLLDERYFNSADRKGVPANERSLGFDLRWQPD